MRRPWLVAVAVLAALVAATVWLRAPTFGFGVWNVDEAIHSAVARELLEGGTLYRDAIDQRTPLSYYAVAAVYAVAGANNLTALHLFTALVIALTAWLLWLAARLARAPGAGLWAAGLYVAWSIALFYQGDAFAFHTEWLLALFTAAAAAGAAQGFATGRERWFAATGAALALAFLSKQPALLDAAAPVAALAWLAWHVPAERRALGPRLLALALGWLAPVAATLAWFAAHGALRDALYYAWTYNVSVYGPEISTADRLASLGKFAQMFLDCSPLLLAWLAITALLGLRRLARARETQLATQADTALVYVLCWSATGLAGAMSGGRGFDHYLAQALPALALLAGGGLAHATRFAGESARAALVRAALTLVLLASAGLLAAETWAARTRTVPVDNSRPPAKFIRALTQPHERIFVWGYHPEFHLFAERRAASRFIYSSFLTGLVPWTNVAPERDTAYAIVPGAMETLLAELEATRPTFIVDCSAGPNRHWQKYPLKKFPALQEFIARRYVLAEPGQFRGQGYDLYLIRDEFRAPGPRPAATATAALAEPVWMGDHRVAPRPADITVEGRCANGQLTRLELLLDEQVVAAASFAPVASLSLRVAVPFQDTTLGRHQLRVRATAADGTTRDGAPHPIDVTDSFLPASALRSFRLPQVAAPLEPLFVSTLYGAEVLHEEGRTIYFAHAPTTLAFPLPAHAARVSGGFGMRPGAYAPELKAPTDGAEFRVELVGADGRRRVLFRRLLDPLKLATDRGMQGFEVALPADRRPEDHLEFVTGPGVNDSPATDWCFWADLRLESSR